MLKTKQIYLKGSSELPWWLIIVRTDTDTVVLTTCWKTRKEARAGQKWYTESPELIRSVPVRAIICKDFECQANKEIK